MQLKLEEKFNQKLLEPFAYKFEVKEKGLHAIEITASCRSWLQNLIKVVSFFKDDDLTVKIDDFEFPKLDGRRGLFDGEVAWNGNNLKGLKKTDIFLINLTKGSHIVQFLIDQKPYLEDIKIYHLQGEAFEIRNKRAEEGNRRQWLTFVLVNLSLKTISITASAFKHKKDDDDLRLIINGKIQKNTEPKSHKYWYWCGRTLEGKKKGFNQEVNLSQGLHYVELWADRMPVVYEMGLGLDLKQKARVVWKHTVLREKPNQGSKILIDKINKNSRVIILEKAIKGERPINEENNEPYLSDRWHFVEYQNTSGYIFSMALEIEGEDEATIKNLIIQKSRELNEDKCLMLAIAKRESQFFPYMVSSENAQGIFQLKEAAVIDVNKEFGKDFNNRFNISQNIEAGILYFQIVKKKYKDKNNFWERCLAGWNRGMGRVSADEAFVIDDQPLATQQFIQDVFKYWEECKNRIKNQGKILPLPLLLIGVVILAVLGLLFFKKSYSIPSSYRDHVILAEEKIDINRDGVKERLVAVNDAPDSTFGITKILLIKENNSFLKLPDDGGEFQWFKVDDFNKNGKTDIAVLYGYSGSAGFGDFHLYEWDNSDFVTLLGREEIGAEADFKDLDNDGIEEILFSYRPLKWSKEELDVYKWNKETAAYIKDSKIDPRY